MYTIVSSLSEYIHTYHISVRCRVVHIFFFEQFASIDCPWLWSQREQNWSWTWLMLQHCWRKMFASLYQFSSIDVWKMAEKKRYISSWPRSKAQSNSMKRKWNVQRKPPKCGDERIPLNRIDSIRFIHYKVNSVLLKIRVEWLACLMIMETKIYTLQSIKSKIK